MKLMKLKKINSVLKKYSTLIITSLLLLTKKDKIPNILFYAVISLLGFFMINKGNEDSNKFKDWKDFINSELGSNNKINDFDEEDENEENDKEDVSEENKNIERNISKIKELIHNNSNQNLEGEDNQENKKDLKIINKRVNKNSQVKEYSEYLRKLNVDYENPDNCLFKLKVNDNNKNTPIFNLRSSDKIDFFYNFHLHNADNSKINSLILCRDIHQWMSNSSISNEDLENRCYPLYFIVRDHKTNDQIMIFEAYKIFVYADENGNKQAFISKGDNYRTVQELLTILFGLGYVKDLLNGKEYESYNLTAHHSVILFLSNLLSHFLPYESKDNELINIDVKQFNENKNTFDYFYHTNIMDNELFNTNI